MLDPITVPVIEGNRVAAQVDIQVMLELAPGKTKEGIEPKQRQLIDAFIRTLYALFQQQTDVSEPIDGTIIKARLRHSAAEVLGPDTVQDVLIQRLFEQPRR
jgi:hypothetical protein